MRIIVQNTLAGLTTSFAMVPEVVAFALLAQVNPIVGLYAAFIVGIIAAIFGGRPGLISGGAGSLAVVSVALVVSHGVEYLFACVLLMGILQLLFGYFKLGKIIKIVSPAVMTGFVNGLAVVIFLAQFHQLKINDTWLHGQLLVNAIALIILTIGIVVLSSKITRKIPSSLIAIGIVTSIALYFNVDTQYVKDMATISGEFPAFHFPVVPLTWETLYIIFPYSLILASIGVLETLLTANMVDNYNAITAKEITNPNKESMAQGAGNLITGLFGGMGGCAMIGQTVINLEAGGYNRLAGIVQSLCILAYIMFASVIIESIPIAALIGVMLVVCYHTFNWKSISLNQPKLDIVVIVTVTIATVLFNLAYAVLIGILLTSVVFYWNNLKENK